MVNTNLKKVIAGASVAAVAIALGASGAFGKFIITDGSVTNNNYGYGYGYDDQTMDYSYGYGYGAQTKSSGKGSYYDGSHNSGGNSTNTPAKPVVTPIKNETPAIVADAKDADKSCYSGVHKFTDIDTTFAKKYIVELEERSVFHGENGKNIMYNPNRQMTRVEYIKTVIRAMCLRYDNEATTTVFKDTDMADWQARVINKAIKLDLITTGNDLVRANDTITRVEALKILMRAKKATLNTEVSSGFTDINAEWMEKYVATAKGMGIVDGEMKNGSKVFTPNRNISRAEAAKVVVKGLPRGVYADVK